MDNTTLEGKKSFFDDLVSVSSDWIWEIDKNENFTFSSPGLYRVLRYASNYVIGKSFWDFVNPSTCKDTYKELKQLIKSHSEIKGQTICFDHKNQTEVVVKVDAKPIFDKGNTFLGYRGICKDISKIQEDIIFSRKTNKHLFENIDDLILIVDEDGVIIEGNHAKWNDFGFKDDIYGKNISEFGFFDTRSLKQVKQLFFDLMRGNKIKKYIELESTNVAGDRLYIEFSIGLIDLDNNRKVFMVIARDVTKEREYEKLIEEKGEEYQIIFEKVCDSILYVDLKGNLIDTNVTDKVLGDYLWKDLKSKNFDDLTFINHDDLRKIKYICRELIKNKKTKTSTIITNVVGQDNKAYKIEMNISLVLKNKGESKFIIVYRDITTQLNERERLVLMFKYQSLLSNISAHLSSSDEVNTKLENVLGFIGRSIEVNRVFIFENYDNNQMIKNTYEWNDAKFKSIKENLQEVPYKIIPSLKKIIKDKKIILADNVRTLSPDISKFFASQSIKSILSYPLYVENKFYGFIVFGQCDYHRKWKENEINVLKIASEIISSAFERKIVQAVLENERYQYASVVEQVGDSIVITDTKGTIQYVNPYFEKITGYKKEEAIGQNPRILKSGIQNDNVYHELWKKITTGSEWRGRFVNKKKNGKLFTEEVLIFPVKEKKHKIIGYAAIKKDISKQIKKEEEFNKYVGMLERFKSTTVDLAIDMKKLEEENNVLRKKQKK